MKRKCMLCYEEIEDGETEWYSPSGVLVEDDVICESCYLELKPMRLN